MHRVVINLVFVLFVSLLFSSCSYLKRHDEKKRIYIVKSNTLNVRKAANTNSEIIGTVYKGDTINDIKTYFDWIKVVYEGDTGYVSSSLVQHSRILDMSRVSNMELGLLQTIIRDALNKYLNWRNWEFWVGIVVMYLLSLGLLALCRKFDDILERYCYDCYEEYSSLPYYTGLFGVLFSFVFMFWREDVLQILFVNKMYWLPEDNGWISWFIWSLSILLILFLFVSFISNLITYRWRGILRTAYYYITALVSFITGLFIGVLIIVFVIVFIILSIVTGMSTITEEGLLSRISHDGLNSLNLSEWRALGNIFRRRGFSKEAGIVDDIISRY
jgi:hypothetical protein